MRPPDAAKPMALAPPARTNRARCRKCNQIVESTHRHDFVQCQCGAIFVDGGHAYLRRGGDIDAIEELSEGWDD